MASRRAVAVEPGAAVLTVTPSAAASSESALEKPTTAERIAVEIVSPAIGCFTLVEVIKTMRPQPRARIPPTTASASF